MHFIAPGAFWMAAVAVPVLLWLWRFRRRRNELIVPSLIPFQHLIEQPPHRHWPRVNWLFWVQLLTLGGLILALAQPFWLGRITPHGADWLLVVDTSASMQAQTRSGIPLVRAREELAQQIRRLGPDDRCAVIRSTPLDLLSKGLTRDAASLRDALTGLERVDLPGDLAGAIALARTLRSPRRTAHLVVITDRPAVEPLPADVQWVRLGVPEPNLILERFDIGQERFQAEGRATATAVVRNLGESAARATVAVTGDGQRLLTETVDVPAGERATVTLDPLPQPVPAVLKAELSGSRNALEADDARYALAAGTAPLRVALRLDDPSVRVFFERVIRATPGLAMPDDGPADLVITDQSATVATEQTVLRILRAAPGQDGLKGRVVDWRTDHPVTRYLEELDELTLRGIPPGGLGAPWLPAVWVSDNQRTVPIVGVQDAAGRRQVAFAFDVTAFAPDDPQAVELVLLTLNALRWLGEASQPELGSLPTGSTLRLPGIGAGRIVVGLPTGERVTVPHTGGTLVWDRLWWSGLYTVTDAAGREQRVAAHLADRAESDLMHPRPVEVRWSSRGILAGLETLVRELPLQHICLLLVLLLLLGEWLAFWRRAQLSQPSAPREYVVSSQR